MKTMPKIGTKVRISKRVLKLRGAHSVEFRKVAVVQSVSLGGVQGILGGLLLDRPIDGFRSWNKLDVVKA